MPLDVKGTVNGRVRSILLASNGRVRSILLASASLPRSLRERRDIIKGCVLLLWPRLREGMLRKLTLIFINRLKACGEGNVV